jgi:hypothetical protein
LLEPLLRRQAEVAAQADAVDIPGMSLEGNPASVTTDAALRSA